MDFETCLSHMVAPGTPREGKYMKGVIQILVTNACDLKCPYCTQGSNLTRKPRFMSLENFETAVISLKEYFGVVGVFGGNPALHPKFQEICTILEKHIPYKRRGIWCNNPLSKGSIMRRTFNPAVSNLNVHGDERAYKEFKEDWPECSPVGLNTPSSHSPVFLSPEDLELSREEIYENISRCDINQHWSALMGELTPVGQYKGELRAWFCEVAAAQCMLFQDVEPIQTPSTTLSPPLPFSDPPEGYYLKESDTPTRYRDYTSLSNPYTVQESSSQKTMTFNGDTGLPVGLYAQVDGSYLPTRRNDSWGILCDLGGVSCTLPSDTQLLQWWQLPMTAFAGQVLSHCVHCAVPLRLRGLEDRPEEGEAELTTAHYREVYRVKGKRPVRVLTPDDSGLVQLGMPKVKRVIDYLKN